MLSTQKETTDDEVNTICPGQLSAETTIIKEPQETNPFFNHPLEIQISELKPIPLSDNPPTRDCKSNRIVDSPDFALHGRNKPKARTGNALLQRLSGKAINAIIEKDPTILSKCQSSEKISNISSQPGTPPHHVHSSNGVGGKHNHNTPTSKFSMDTQKLEEVSLTRRSKTSSVIGPNGVEMCMPIIGKFVEGSHKMALDKEGCSTLTQKRICCEISSNTKIRQVCCIVI